MLSPSLPLIWIDALRKVNVYIYILSSNFELCTRVTQLRSTYRSTSGDKSQFYYVRQTPQFLMKTLTLKSMLTFFHCRCLLHTNTIETLI